MDTGATVVEVTVKTKKNTPEEACAAFKTKVEAQGGTVLGTYVNSDTPVHVRCVEGHDCSPRPSNVQGGQGICVPCGIAAKVQPKVARAEIAFRARLAELGATLLEPRWLGALKNHHVRCADGHDCYPSPAHTQRGVGVCRTCAGQDPAAAEAEFRTLVEAAGGIVLEDKWLGSDQPHHVRCAAGHDSYPYPGHTRRGIGICRTCAGMDPAVAGANFRAALTKAGATLLEPYVNKETPVHVRCAEGHDCYPRPGNVRTGHGFCMPCAGKHDVFYVVTGHRGLKLGVSSNGGDIRLARHRRAGYGDQTIRLWVQLPESVADKAEKLVKALLTEHNYEPNMGAEYFDIEVLPVVTGLVDRELAQYTPVIGPGADPWEELAA